MRRVWKQLTAEEIGNYESHRGGTKIKGGKVMDALSMLCMATGLIPKDATCRTCKHRGMAKLNCYSSKIIHCCTQQPSKRSNSGYKTIKVTDKACFRYEKEERKTEKWRNDLIRCPSQCYCYFEAEGKKYCIYLRWRWGDPWTAQIVPVDNRCNFLYECNWEDVETKFYSHDDYEKLQEECIEIIKNRFNEIKWL